MVHRLQDRVGWTNHGLPTNAQPMPFGCQTAAPAMSSPTLYVLLSAKAAADRAWRGCGKECLQPAVTHSGKLCKGSMCGDGNRRIRACCATPLVNLHAKLHSPRIPKCSTPADTGRVATSTAARAVAPSSPTAKQQPTIRVGTCTACRGACQSQQHAWGRAATVAATARQLHKHRHGGGGCASSVPRQCE